MCIQFNLHHYSNILFCNSYLSLFSSGEELFSVSLKPYLGICDSIPVVVSLDWEDPRSDTNKDDDAVWASMALIYELFHSHLLHTCN